MIGFDSNKKQIYNIIKVAFHLTLALGNVNVAFF